MGGLLSDKAAVVTGGASGNGRAIARTFAEHGADVVVADLLEEPRGGGKSTAELIESETTSSATFVECDVTDRSDLESAIGTAETYGGIDIMVNNAGVVWAESVLETTEESYQKMMDVNAKAVFFGSQIAAERMMEKGDGNIINIGSISGLQGSGNSIVYSASKGAVKLMTYSLGNMLGPDGIRVNVIHPGRVDTELLDDNESEDDTLATDHPLGEADDVPLGRIAEPDDIANVAVFLASDLAGYVTAESITVDGGRMNTSNR